MIEAKKDKLRRILELRLGLSVTWKSVTLTFKGDKLIILWSDPKRPPFSFHSKEIGINEIDRVIRQQLGKLNNERKNIGNPEFNKLVQ